MNEAHASLTYNQRGSSVNRPGTGRRVITALALPAGILLTWIVAWTILFSAIDFWTLKLYDVSRYSWFQDYRAVMRYGASWISPPSFALAENAYFVWMNMYDPNYRMHEWEWYSGNPVNPDGYFNFVWGNGSGGWMRFPMKAWYGVWLLPTAAWGGGLLLLLARRKRNLRPV